MKILMPLVGAAFAFAAHPLVAQAVDPGVSSVLGGLLNMGGVGLFAVAIFFLHRDALKNFREDLNTERVARSVAFKDFRDDIDRERNDQERRHSQNLTEFRALRQLTGGVQRTLSLFVTLLQDRRGQPFQAPEPEPDESEPTPGTR